MKNPFSTFVRIGVFAVLTIGFCLPAPAQTSPADAPQPEKVFIGNAGAVKDDKGPEAAAYAEQAYNAFFLAMKQWGHYEIVADESRADWIIEISTTNSEVCHDRREQRETGKPAEEDHFRIDVLMTDARTKDLRARLGEEIGIPSWRASSDRLFDQTIVDLMDALKKEVGGGATNTPPVPHNEPMAPVPPRIGLAQKVYVHNLGVTDDPGWRYTGGPAELYNQFAAQLNNWGKYQIVPEADADLVLDISFSAPPTCELQADPQIALYVHDAGTDTALWAFSVPVAHALRATTARKNFAQDMAALVRDLRGVAEQSTWALNASVPAKPEAVATLISAALDPNSAPVPASISVAPNVVKSGSNISATVIVKNSTKLDFNFLYPQGDPLACAIAVRRSDGKDVKETQEGTKITAAHAGWKGPPASYELHPGEKQTRQCAVSTLFDMSIPGEYLVEVKALDGRLVASNVATVTVVPR